MKNGFAVTTGLVLAILTTTSVAANATIYTTRAAFSAAAGATTTTDFGQFDEDVSFLDKTVDAGAFTLSMVNPDPLNSYNFVDVVPVASSEWNVNGTNVVSVLTSPGGSLLLTLKEAATAFGADFRNLNDGVVRTRIYVDGVEMTPPVLPDDTNSFFGFVLPTAFTVVEFRGQSDEYDGFGMDNVTINAAPAVPEPASWAMMIAGFGLAGAAVRRQRRMIAFA